MRISAQEEYGLRCILQLAQKGSSGVSTIPEIAEREGLSVEYTGKLMMLLRNAGLVESMRGKNGGYVLAGPAERITLGKVMRALSRPLFEPDSCDDYPGQAPVCVHRKECSIRPVWVTIGALFTGMLDHLCLADLQAGEAEVAGKVRQRLLSEMCPVH
ncbi:MAG: Rrf2 family transcriptional regulator [Acidobacteria bacterium]|nr:Rrf2 family transcriptional regulator [Acidobacteriota bacterium]